MNDTMKKAMEKRKAKAKEAELAKEEREHFGDSDFEFPKWVGIEQYPKAVKIPGTTLPYEVREKGTDAKFIMYSKIVNSKKTGYNTIFWKVSEKNGNKIPDPDWILTELYNKVGDKTWEDFDKPRWDENKKKEVRGEYIYHNKDTEVYKVLYTKDGNKKKDERYPKEFKPTSGVVMNVIDLMDDWCAKNKHTKLWSRKVNDWEVEDKKTGEMKTIQFVEPSITATAYPSGNYSGLYDQLMDYFDQIGEFWDASPIWVYKQGMKYDFFDSDDKRCNGSFSSYKEAPKELQQSSLSDFTRVKEVTEEELAYEMYDLDEKFQPTSYTSLLSKLGWLFKLCDGNLGTDFFERLTELANEEKEQRKVEREANQQKEEKSEEKIEENTIDEEKENSNESNDIVPDLSDVKSKDDVSEEKPRERKRVRQTSSDEPITEETLKQYFPKWDELGDEDIKEMLKSVKKVDSDIILYHDGVTLFPCDKGKCKFGDNVFQMPEDVFICPICGANYEG